MVIPICGLQRRLHAYCTLLFGKKCLADFAAACGMHIDSDVALSDDQELGGSGLSEGAETDHVRTSRKIGQNCLVPARGHVLRHATNCPARKIEHYHFRPGIRGQIETDRGAAGCRIGSRSIQRKVKAFILLNANRVPGYGNTVEYRGLARVGR